MATAVAGSGWVDGPYCQIVSVSLAAAVPDAPPTPNATALSQVAIKVTWTKPADSGAVITGYRLQYCLATGTEWVETPALAGGDVLATDVDGLNPSTQYRFRVLATNSIGESAWSVEASATTLDPTPSGPSAPEIKTSLSHSPSTIEVTWNPPAPVQGVDITGYELQLRKAGAGAWGKALPIQSTSKLDNKFTKLKSMTEYEWRVLATSASGKSEFSSVGTATTLKSVADKLHEVKIELDKQLGNSCPDVSIDVEKMKIVLSDEINFKGGKAIILKDDLPIQAQLEKTIVMLYTILKSKGYDMFHIRFDGHVHPTGKDMRCLVISYFRAAEIVRRVVKAGCPHEFLHAYGYGQRMPVTSDKKKADLNRRVEINFIDHHHIQSMDEDARKLWKEITPTDAFDVFTKEPASFDHEYHESVYAPHSV
jgi:outer membrane protein OmpA-like peptidoglycan-associated protein